MISWGEDNVPYSSFLVELLAPHMAKECTVNVSNQGVSGETTAEILQRAPFGEHWDVVVLLGGTNDLGTHEAEAIWRNLHEMYTRFEASPTKPLIVAVTIPNICAVLFAHHLACAALISCRRSNRTGSCSGGTL